MEYSTDGESYYDGDWVDNIRQGFGTRRYPSGNVYEGMWYKNRRHGLGTMHWFDRNQSYTGNWEDGVQVVANHILVFVVVNVFPSGLSQTVFPKTRLLKWTCANMFVSTVHRVRKKRGHVIFDCNSRQSWWIFIMFSPLETGMNTAQLYVIYLLNGFITS